ncbi:MAG: rod shape-determining protein MreD [Alkalibacterium sp.]|nr:rod shape-determining protein MreD [Alkalibacterium sp.]TVP92413.1 MAG: rod shape-determining protein MreD [Alkalibacterium sp.]
MEQWRRVIIPIVLLFFFLLLDGVIVSLFYESLDVSFGFMTPRLFVLTVIVLSFFLEPRHMYILSIVFGFIYDSYYSGILGIYIAGLMIISYFIIQLRNILEPNYLTMVLVTIIMLTLLEFLIFGIYRVIDLTSLSVQEFIAMRLSASLLFNTIAIIILAVPLKFSIKLITLKSKEKSTQSKSRATYR